MSKQFKIGELARRAGLTVRTLHHYDDIGLLVPSLRNSADYRLYSEADVKRLFHVVTLTRLDMPLARIAELLQDRETDMSAVIDGEIARLERQIAQASAMHTRMVRLKGQFAERDAMALDDTLRILNQLHVQDQHFSAEELSALRATVTADQDWKQAHIDWPGHIATLRQHMEAGAPIDAPQVQAIAQIWTKLYEVMLDQNPELGQRIFAMYENEPSLQAQSGLEPALLDYMKAACKLARRPKDKQ